MLIISPNLTKVYILAVDRRNKYNSQEKMLIYIESLEIMGGGWRRREERERDQNTEEEGE